MAAQSRAINIMANGMELGRYRILRPLGHGGMATVYLGEDPILNRLVAIKVIQTHLSSNEKLIERFTVEAKTIASLQHVNIVEIFDFGVQDDQQFLVMEYVDGQSLQALCTAMAGRPMPDTVVAAIICQAAEGLTSAERHGVVHRDIKPENLLLNSAGVLKIADFGIAHIIDEQSHTQTGAVLGSPNFMSPEQVEGLKPTPKADLFALGGVFYSCLTGKMPFTGSSIPVTLHNICEKRHAPVVEHNPGADPFLIQVIDTLLQKDPMDRGEGAHWLAGQLKGWLNRHGVVDPADHVHAFISGLDLPPSPTLVGTQFPATDHSRSGTRNRGKGSLFRLGLPWIWAGVFLALIAAVVIFWMERNPTRVHKAVRAAASSVVRSSDTGANGERITVGSRAVKSKQASNKPAENSGKSESGAAFMKGGQPGLLLIQSAPPFAAININGKPHGETPMHSWLEIPPGKYHLELLHRLAPPFDTDIYIFPGSRQKFKFKLER